ncbi:L-methionine gamma-lyase [Rhodovastum atsumiense]|uniref:Aminotransferase class I/II-fold pyridoxal phosphate-dependent enzyme n=1 Tax=Rhodovastum atsumiense TaxID=504468 RepID=A0A5M6ILB9_9PROT|nr:aminotransferase class I/II-fold pyridoxal phosphate-dependent enzyme [Rhodovastum atsumiense]KAA5608659.1 aminotransferase class I/II-fold pyridoxal phosphate-dependent enzyme [Rhodovastum atsumiense]CAH2598817.1 L-methionine gamma-lyase [Rhodovastum atsumiense]
MTTSDSNRRPHGFATRAIHVGYDPASAHGALTPPVFMTSTYAFETVEDGLAISSGEKPGYVYGRTRNPTQTILETRIADLEGAEAGLALASGMAAISATLWTLLGAGDRVVIDQTLYGNSYVFFTRGLTRFGVSVTVADLTDPDDFAQALRTRPKLVYFETPANPNLRVIDIAAVAAQAHAAGARVIVDNTFATPVLQRPIELGADLVVHSATKFLGGHGDLLGGVVVGSQTDIAQIRGHGLRYLTGATMAPLTAFLLLRGLKTLELRVQRHSASAMAVAATLAAHPAVRQVFYPGLLASPFHPIAARQMRAFGGLLACELSGGIEAGRHFMNQLTLAHRAVSLGDAETLVQHPASMTHAAYPPEERHRHGISDGLIRLSIGLETPEDIIEDILQALEASQQRG